MIEPGHLSQMTSALLFVLGVALPLVGSAMIPRGSRRWAAAIFCLVGIGFMLGLAGSGAIGLGVGVGFVLAAIKLLTGISFL